MVNPCSDQYAEWLAITRRTDPDGTLAKLAADVSGDGSPTEAAINCLRTIGEHLDVRTRLDRRRDQRDPGLGRA